MSMSRRDKVFVFSETKGGRVKVGALWRERKWYVFEYERAYQKLKNAIPLGPEFPLWKRSFKDTQLFPSLADRIPSRRNPAYEDYCQQWGIDTNENDPLVLLTTIGRRGPSTFVFDRERASDYGGKEVKAFRSRLGLSQREFEHLFGISHATLVKLEAGKSKNALMFHHLQICDEVPEALEWLVDRQGQLLLDRKRLMIKELIAFHKEWRASPAARLMVPDLDIQLFLPEEEGGYISLAFGARKDWCDDLKRLDELVEKFSIVNKATPDFKSKLQERWLDKPIEKRRDVCNQVRSAWAEFVVADHLDVKGYDITDLEAWNKGSSDISCRKDKDDYHVEVKYFSESPEWSQCLRKAAQGKKSGFSGPPEENVMNYAFSRVAKAAIQLKHYPRNERHVWFVIDVGIVPEMASLKKIWNEHWKAFVSWHKEGANYAGIPKDKDLKQILGMTPHEWLQEIDRLTIATMKHWRITSCETQHNS